MATGGFDVNLAPLPAAQAIVLDTRLYDAAGRQVRSGPADTLPQAYVDALNAGGAADANGARTRTARYDDNGRLLAQHVTKPDGAADYDLVYAGSTTSTFEVQNGTDESGNPVFIQQTITTTGPGYDAAGNVLGYQVTDSSGVTSSYNFTQTLFEGYKESTASGFRSDTLDVRTTTSSYDINGNLIGINGNGDGQVAKSFINDTNGIIVQQSTGNDANAPTSRQIVSNGQVWGSYGFAQPSAALATPAGYFNNLPPGMVISATQFDASFQPINSGYPPASVGSYLVQTGDTLQSIAQSAYGDRQL